MQHEMQHKKGLFQAPQSVEKVRQRLDFFYLMWYNKVG